jgi:aspartate/methionine/tyrosine aminotransferase
MPFRKKDNITAVAEGSISNRSLVVEWSGIRTISTMLRNIKEGAISLSIGQPDFDTPEHIRTAAKRALDEGYTRYPPAKGFQDLREAIAGKLKAKNNLAADPDSEIFVSSGAMHAIFNATLQLIDPGDEVILMDPGYDYYSQIRLFGGRPVPVAVYEQNKYKVDPGDLRKAVTGRTKLIILNSPANPTGAFLDKSTIIEIAKIAMENGIYVLSDECYEDMVFDGEHFSIASYEGMKDLAVSVFSFSKSYAMTGWRVGYVTANSAIINEMEKLMEHMLSGVSAVSQRAALAALQGPQDCIGEMVRAYRRRRDLVCSLLREIDGVSCVVPEATFYAFPNISKICPNSWDFARYLLAEQKVGTVPGCIFGSNGEAHLRISYATDEHNLREGLSRIRKAVETFRNKN